jgi:phosphoglycolate phosphatase-like HAD superfamily hydrolase
VQEAELKIAVASSAKANELDVYLDLAGITHLIDIATSSEDAEHSKPAPDIFQVALRKLGLSGPDAIAIGDTPYNAIAAGKAQIPTIGMLSGGFTEIELREAGCQAVYPGPGALLACFAASLLAR